MRKEAAFNAVRGGSFAAAQVSTQGEALKKLFERQNELREKFAEAQGHYGANHPEYRKASGQVAEVERQIELTRFNVGQRVESEYQEAGNREHMLAQAVSQTKAQFDQLNLHSFEYQALKREAEGDRKVYDELVRKIKEAGINASFQNSAIRIADAARPFRVRVSTGGRGNTRRRRRALPGSDRRCAGRSRRCWRRVRRW